jgi:Zn-finger nucleic acid-binding protein
MDKTEAFLAELERSELEAIAENDEIVPSGERPCPICGSHMDVEQMSGVNVDVCAKHGVWLDRGELPRILATSNASVRRRHADAIRKARRDGKKSGVIFGVWSLLLD